MLVLLLVAILKNCTILSDINKEQRSNFFSTGTVY